MKKTIAIFVIIGAMLMSACSSGKPSSVINESSSEPVESAVDQQSSAISETEADFDSGAKSIEYHGLKLDIPSNWTNRTGDDGVEYFYPSHNNGMVMLSYQINPEGSGEDPFGVAEALLQGMGEVADSFEKKSDISKESSSNGVVYYKTYVQMILSGTELEAIVYFVFSNDDIYTVVCSNYLPVTFDSFSDYELVGDTFSFGNSAAFDSMDDASTETMTIGRMTFNIPKGYESVEHINEVDGEGMVITGEDYILQAMLFYDAREALSLESSSIKEMDEEINKSLYNDYIAEGDPPPYERIENSQGIAFYKVEERGTYTVENGTIEMNCLIFRTVRSEDLYTFIIYYNFNGQQETSSVVDSFIDTVCFQSMAALYPTGIPITKDNFIELFPESEIEKIDSEMEKYCRFTLVSDASKVGINKTIKDYMKVSTWCMTFEDPEHGNHSVFVFVYGTVSDEKSILSSKIKTNLVKYHPYVIIDPYLVDGKIVFDDKMYSEYGLSLQISSGIGTFLLYKKFDKELGLSYGYDTEDEWKEDTATVLFLKSYEQNLFELTKLE